MGMAKAAWMEAQLHQDVAEALEIGADELDGYGYQIEGSLIIWDEHAPDGVKAHVENGRLVSVVDFPDHPDGPDDE